MVNGCRRGLRACLIKACKSSLCFRAWSQKLVHILNWSSRMISYPNYKFTFTIKALGMFAKHFGDAEVL